MVLWILQTTVITGPGRHVAKARRVTVASALNAIQRAGASMQDVTQSSLRDSAYGPDLCNTDPTLPRNMAFSLVQEPLHRPGPLEQLGGS